MLRAAAVAVCLMIAPGFFASARAEPYDLDGLLERSVAAYGRVTDLVCSFSTRERIRDGIVERKHILFKFRKPESFYMKLTEGGDEGTELLYVEGRYGNELKVHLSGFWGLFPIAVDPRGSLALKNNRHPVMDADIGHILDLVVSNYRKGKNDPDSRITYEGEGELDGRGTIRAKAVFPPGKGYYGRTVQIQFDRETALPVMLTVHGWEDEFLEEYRYENVRLNVGLTDRDFDARNPEYRF